MSHSRKILAIVAITVVAAIVVTISFEPTGYTRAIVFRQALHRGKITRDWRQTLAEDGQAGHISDETIRLLTGVTAPGVLTELMDDADRNVRWPAVVLLRENFFRGSSANRLLPALRVALHDADPEVRLQAAITLNAMKAEGRSLFFELAALRNDPEAQIQLAADRALWSVHAEKAREVSDWTIVDSKSKGFEASFPEEPTTTETTREHDGRTIKMHVDQATQWKVTKCMVIVCDYGTEIKLESTKRDFERQLGDHLGLFLNAKPVSEKAITQFDREGIETVHEYLNTFLIRRSFWVGSRLYVIAIVTNPEFANEAANAFFLDSLRIR